MGLVLGLALAFILGTGLHFGAKIFTKDADVLHLIQIGIPVIIGFQIRKDIGNLSFQSQETHFHVHSFTSLWLSLNL